MSYGGGDASAVFLLSVTGQVSSGRFPSGSTDLYCKTCFVAGPDWAVTAGQEEGISQIARKGRPADGAPDVVWNFPLDVTFRSTCPHGWPQLVVSVYEMDNFGNEMVRGYGSTHVPLSTGSHSAKMPVFRPESSSLLQRMAGYVTGRRPEFVDPRVVASGEGRDVTRVTTNGWVRVTFSVITKDLKRLGYETAPRNTESATAGSSSAEAANRGPGEGIGLLAKDDGKKRRRSRREEDEAEAIDEEEEEDGGGAQGGSGVVVV